jgi:hypothetical protein
MLKLCLLMAAILDGGRGHRTQFWKYTPEPLVCFAVLIIYLFISPCQRQCELSPSLGVRRPSSVVRRLLSVNFSHFNLLLWKPLSQVNWEKNFKNQPIRNKNRLWWPCLLTDRDEVSNLYRRPAIDAYYQVSVHLAERFQRRRFSRNHPIRNKNACQRQCELLPSLGVR